jgi:hypothetical protein
MSKKVTTILLLFSIALAPSLRSCGYITYGFPTVSMEAKNPVAVEKIHPLNTLINLIFIVLLFILFMRLMRNSHFSRIFNEGLPGIYAYQVVLFFSYLILYWCIYISDKFLMILYLLYPLSTTLLDLDKPLLKSISEHSPFFGDKLDITLRLNFLFSLLLWFLAAVLILRIKKIYREKKKNIPPTPA